MAKAPVNFFLAGFQKCGSTWLHRCFLEHTDIFLPNNDTIHYFTLNYHKGVAWYHEFFKNLSIEKIIVDPTPSYWRECHAAKRIFQYNPEAKILFSIRNPIDRAFSHYWHKKRKNSIAYNFSDTLFYRGVGNHDLYNDFIRPGFYYELITPWIELFGENQVKIVFFDDLQSDAEKYLEDIFNFMGVNPYLKPTILHEKVNAANSGGQGIKKSIHNLITKFRHSNPNEYKHGMPNEMRIELREIFKEDIQKVSELTKRDLSHWK